MATTRAAEGVPAQLGFFEAGTGFPNGKSNPAQDWPHVGLLPSRQQGRFLVTVQTLTCMCRTPILTPLRARLQGQARVACVTLEAHTLTLLRRCAIALEQVERATQQRRRLGKERHRVQRACKAVSGQRLLHLVHAAACRNAQGLSNRGCGGTGLAATCHREQQGLCNIFQRLRQTLGWPLQEGKGRAKRWHLWSSAAPW